MSTIAQDAGAVRPEARALTLADVGMLVARLGLGAVMFAHGAQKALGWFGGPGLGPTIRGFTGMMHIPAPLAYLVVATEFLGGLALIFGVLGRLAALGIAIEMLVAVLMVHAHNGFFMNWAAQPGQMVSRGEGFEYHIIAVALALTIVLVGPGRIALADWEGRILHR